MSRSAGGSHEKTYRDGAVGALMDELERAVDELVRLVGGLRDETFEAVRDPEAEAACRSVQSVVNHVVRAGYGHANHIRVALGLPGARVEVPLGTRAESADQLAAMVAYFAATLEGRWQMPDEAIEGVQIESMWGPIYDLEQMLEHAIVHVHRHRRQIERFLASS